MSGSINRSTKSDDRSNPRERSEFAMDEGASGGLKSQDLTEGVFEDPRDEKLRRSDDFNKSQGVLRDHHGGMNPLKAFTSEGAVGKQFNPDGTVGSIPNAIGGPLSKDGLVGKQFTSEGIIGGTVDKLLGEKKSGKGEKTGRGDKTTLGEESGLKTGLRERDLGDRTDKTGPGLGHTSLADRTTRTGLGDKIRDKSDSGEGWMDRGDRK